MSEEAEEFNEFDSLDPQDLIRTMIASAISLGAPVYNTGDHRGCFEIYAATARLLNHIVDGAEEERELLRGALEIAALEVDVNEQAWVMRRVFDTILGEETVEEEPEGEEPLPPTE